jgi:HEAT repeat protein
MIIEADQFHTEDIRAAMLEMGAVESIVKLLESQNDDVRRAAADALGRMAKHGGSSSPCMINELTDLT